MEHTNNSRRRLAYAVFSVPLMASLACFSGPVDPNEPLADADVLGNDGCINLCDKISACWGDRDRQSNLQEAFNQCLSGCDARVTPESYSFTDEVKLCWAKTTCDELPEFTIPRDDNCPAMVRAAEEEREALWRNEQAESERRLKEAQAAAETVSNELRAGLGTRNPRKPRVFWSGEVEEVLQLWEASSKPVVASDVEPGGTMFQWFHKWEVYGLPSPNSYPSVPTPVERLFRGAAQARAACYSNFANTSDDFAQRDHEKCKSKADDQLRSDDAVQKVAAWRESIFEDYRQVPRGLNMFVKKDGRYDFDRGRFFFKATNISESGCGQQFAIAGEEVFDFSRMGWERLDDGFRIPWVLDEAAAKSVSAKIETYTQVEVAVVVQGPEPVLRCKPTTREEEEEDYSLRLIPIAYRLCQRGFAESSTARCSDWMP